MVRMIDILARWIRPGHTSIDSEADHEISSLTRRLKCDPELIIKKQKCWREEER